MVLVFVSKLSSKIIISSIQFGSASAFYCSGFMPPSRPSISLNTGPAKVIVIGLMFDRAEKVIDVGLTVDDRKN
ncbi:hypothetical protein OIU79_011248 [Salix purpurea]|uniref:Uncharacterized protein n=1 Tax=Salix purpurea TaxID=77065 RepID=A0A9Q0Q0V0_SALPP|nr:hypothetical protein OIU79_011248 [Salix purpurea]